MAKHQKAFLDDSITVTNKRTNYFVNNCQGTALAGTLGPNRGLKTMIESDDKELAVKLSAISINPTTSSITQNTSTPLSPSSPTSKIPEPPAPESLTDEPFFFSSFDPDLCDPDPPTLEYDEDSLSDLYYTIGESNRHHLLPSHLY